jgi:hypothetical protein
VPAATGRPDVVINGARPAGENVADRVRWARVPSKALPLGGAALRVTASVTGADAAITGPEIAKKILSAPKEKTYVREPTQDCRATFAADVDPVTAADMAATQRPIVAAMVVACAADIVPAQTASSSTGRALRACARATNRAAAPGLTRNCWRSHTRVLVAACACGTPRPDPPASATPAGSTHDLERRLPA